MMYRFSKEDFKQIRIIEQKIEEPEVVTTDEGIVEEINVQRDPYMWEVPKADRKDLLLKKVGFEKFEVIYGKNKDDLMEHRRRPQITIPEPFVLSKNRGNKMRKAFIQAMIRDEAKEQEEAESYKFVSKVIPRSTTKPKYAQIQEKEELRKEFWNARRELKRRGV